MSNVTRSPRRRKPVARLIGILEPPTADMPGLLKIIQGKEAAIYWYREIPADFGGRAFELRKFQAEEAYHVLLPGNGCHGSCECKGHLRHGHCKHSEGLQALEQAGRLPRFRSAADMARNAPEEHAEHEASIEATFTPRAKDWSRFQAETI
jgi:hypothetical protein